MTQEIIHPTDEELFQVKSVIDWFKDRKQKKYTLFDYQQAQYFWSLSDLNFAYPKHFNPKTPFSSTVAYNLKNYAIKTVPTFEKLDYTPVHFETVRETYNIYDDERQRILKIRNGKNQKLSLVACEYIFNQIPRHEVEQACFLFPNDSLPQSVYEHAEEIKLMHARQQITETMKKLSSLINRCDDKKGPNPYALIIGNFWNKLYDAPNSETLHIKNNIRNDLSPLDYMKTGTLIYINNLFQIIINQFWNSEYVKFEQIKAYMEDAALFARSEAIYKYRTRPECSLLPTDTTKRINAINKARKNLLETYYPLSLSQR